jgi:type I restriction enzyme S subunit
LIESIDGGKSIRCIERPPGPGERGIVKISAVTWGRFQEDESKTVQAAVQLDERARIRPGDVLISRANTVELVGACVRVGTISRTLYLSDKVLRLVALPQLLPWLHRYLTSHEARAAIGAASSGNQLSMRNISQTSLRALSVPLAPLREQRRILEIVEASLAQIHSCRTHLDRVPQLLRKFRETVLEAAVSGALTEEWRASRKLTPRDVNELKTRRERNWQRLNGGRRARYSEPIPPDASAAPIEVPAGWVLTSASTLALFQVGFAFPSASFGRTGVRLLRGENIAPGRTRWDDEKLWPHEELQPFRHLLLEEHDLVLGMDRPIVAAGLKLARIAEKDLPALLVQRVMRFVTGDAEDLAFLELCLRAPRFVAYLQAHGMTGSDLPHITGDAMAEYPVALPPREEQREIVRRVDELFALADSIERRYGAAVAKIEKLTPAILGKAFRGELVPQDPADEPAEKMLERMRTERGEAGA